MFFDGYGYHGTSFEQTYQCYSASFIEKPQIELGDKIIMPPSALDRLASLHIDYPMLFELRNEGAERVSHCGVLEFIAEEGMIYMPYWFFRRRGPLTKSGYDRCRVLTGERPTQVSPSEVQMMENMLLQEGDRVKVKNVTLPKGTYVKLQPHTTDFLDISNPKAILETTLRNFSCLTTGDSIMVAYNNKKYYIDIIEAKPSNAISIIETDCEVDFAPPLDYKEPEKPPMHSPSNKAKGPVQEAEPEYSAFSGVGRRLDGKPSKHHPSPVFPSRSNDKKRASGSDNSSPQSPAPAASSSQNASGQSQGKLVFGSNVNRNLKETKENKGTKQEEATKKDEPKFQPFTGKGRSLRG